MDENILDFLMYSNLGKNNFYKGTYASNELNLHKIRISNFDKSKCIGFIFNTLNRNQTNKIGHWLGLYVKIESGLKNIHVKFIDSYKIPYVLYGRSIVSYIARLREIAMSKKAKFIFEQIPFRLQSDAANTCGAYCIYGLTKLAKCNSISLKTIFSKFNKKLFRDILLRFGQKNFVRIFSIPKRVYIFVLKSYSNLINVLINAGVAIIAVPTIKMSNIFRHMLKI